MTSILCFYHAPCNDGSASAAALEYRLGQANYLDGHYELRFCPLAYVTDWDQPFHDDYLADEVQPSHVVSEIYIVDISMSQVKFEDLMLHLMNAGKAGESKPRVVCIDHHLTALEKIEELKSFCDETYIHIGPGLSGATLVWKYFNERFNEDLETPELLRYVADQDIWEWKLQDSREINAALNVLNGTVEAMQEELRDSLADTAAWHERRRAEGSAITSMVDSQVRRSTRQALNLALDEIELRVVNATSFSSELGNNLCEESESSPNVLAIIYSVQADWSVRCSVRSIEGGAVNARQFAERFGGGGHDHAAGCRFATFEAFRETIEKIDEEEWW